MRAEELDRRDPPIYGHVQHRLEALRREEVDLDAGAFRDDEVELVGAGEVADAGVADAGGLVRRHDVVPRAHRRRPPPPPEEEEGSGLCGAVESQA